MKMKKGVKFSYIVSNSNNQNEFSFLLKGINFSSQIESILKINSWIKKNNFGVGFVLLSFIFVLSLVKVFLG
jgi:hypothetical protein